MKLWIAATALAALASFPSFAQESATLPTVTLNYAAQPIKIDGKLDDRAWRDATAIPLGTIDGKPILGGAIARMTWDNKNIYFGAEMPDETLVASRLGRDGILWEKDDVIELFLWPQENQPYYYEIVVNPRGTLYDAFFIARPTHDGPDLSLPDWSPNIDVALRLDPVLYRPDRIGPPSPGGYWSVEMAIPIASLSSRGATPVNAGDSWRAQINRYNRPDPVPGQLDATCWAPYYTVGAPYLLDRFGRITFAGGAAPVVPPVLPEPGAVRPVAPTAPAPTASVVPVVPVAPAPAPVAPAPAPVTPPAPAPAPAPATPAPTPATPEAPPATPTTPAPNTPPAGA